ncbi:50S ribosomal protein L20-like [Hydractinia symbiolongicarpus]|uniref:50S ribosomal protein L20-like n=1 Tax=Hydractinia symbiolongicarpus TaxID=13093 RepID=UPI00254F8180|nr:50S ribosomal protein L20-like [Hydractinia symbiolongicarpus]
MQLSYIHMVRAGPFKRIVRKAKIFALAKGFRGRRKNCYSLAVRSVHKALQRQYMSRKLKKRDIRKLWIQRINMSAREHNVPYSMFIKNMHESNILLNRKMLSELAIHEPRTFHALSQLAKDKQKDGLLAALD